MIYFSANSEDPDETPHHVASHLGLRSLTMSHLWVIYVPVPVMSIYIYIYIS